MDNWEIRYRIPAVPGPSPLLLLLHGWTGDENAMFVFSNKLPESFFLLSPRGIYPTPLGGYGWHDHNIGKWPSLADFQPAVIELLRLLNNDPLPGVKADRFGIVGFSQGAALAYSFALMNPRRVNCLACMSGFVPTGIDHLVQEKPLDNLPVFITHGTRDDIVPVEKARQGAEIMELAGADVNYCEDDVGHKLSASCFRNLETFLQQLRFSA